MHVADHIGKTFHYGTVTERAPGDGRPGARWKLRCKCGTTYEARGIDLTTGKVRSCGCLKRERLEDLTGQQFGRWTALRRTDPSRTGLTRWECRCDCGTVRLIHAGALKSGHTKSCGCLRSEIQGTQALKHGHCPAGSPSATYVCWSSMIARCGNSKDIDYGGRGITICQQWRESFEAFLADMGERPDGMSLDRFPDTNGPYEPGNCRWATRTQQTRNRRNTTLLTHNGETRPLAEWAEILGIKAKTIHMRLRRGATHAEALKPV